MTIVHGRGEHHSFPVVFNCLPSKRVAGVSIHHLNKVKIKNNFLYFHLTIGQKLGKILALSA
ncbi:hypothetical protein CBFG_02579 [Clostridiales bacterium 1_7_47FAA]|nr:hypothetical protein CBFG_02579 [Clostridiales bacterium 1_7_47FAA]